MFDNLTNEYSENPEYEAITFEENEKEEYDLSEKITINSILRATLVSFTNGLQVESLLSSLVSGYYLIPKFQRKYIWKKKQVSNLALSLIKDVPIPPLYLYVNNRKKQVILDGQQRVTSLFLYFNDLWYEGTEEYHRLDFCSIDVKNNELRQEERKMALLDKNDELSYAERSTKRKVINENIKRISLELKKMGVSRSKFYIKDSEKDIDISFSSFSDDEKEFLRRKRLDITVVECKDSFSSKVYADIFKLLNSGGKLLSAQEIRNGVYWELLLYDELFEVNKNTTWRAIYGKESDVSKDVEILLKILALNYYTVIKDNRIKIEYDGTFNWSNIMEEYSIESATWSKEKVLSQIKLLTDFIDAIKNINRAVKKCNKAVFEASFVAYTKAKCTEDIEYMWLCGLDQEKEFQKGQVLSNKKSVEDRLTKALYLIEEKYGVYHS